LEKSIKMKKLNVRFSVNTKNKISELASGIDITDSVVARAAMEIGLEFLTEYKRRNPNSKSNFEDYTIIKNNSSLISFTK
jgi:hypothetical protein